MTTDDLDQPAMPRFVVGIDLGTTNCALCYVDTEQPSWQVESFRIPQWVDVGQLERRETLPSFHYELTASEQASGLKLPWEKAPEAATVGVLARDAGQRHPGRRAAPAKSWLSHDGVDRTANLLPWHGDADVQKLSPVDASAAYLRHLRQAWDHAHPKAPLAEQDVIITLPASFDEVARELTVQAAKQAGLPRIYLIEEPQAAFYAWIDRQGADWEASVHPGQQILVCDIGGGTTDLTLIRVRAAGEGQQVQFHRVAVGRHLILGGDNLDLALAKRAEAKLMAETDRPEPLAPRQWDRLVQAARAAKETLLGEPRPPSYTINLPAEGSRLVGGALQIELTAEEVDETLLEGFFPDVSLADRPAAGASGFQEFGLPYAADPAVTKHLAAFLAEHRRSGLSAEETEAAEFPELVLFNGGVMVSPAVRQRVVDSLGRWFAEERDPDWRPQVLVAARLDLAVAQGAAYYGMVRRGEGVRIAANLGRSYYMQVSDNPPAGMCLIPGDAEAGQRFRCESHPLELQVGAPVQFPLWVSSTRLADRVGELVTMVEGEVSALPPICTALMRGKRRRQEETLRVVVEAELSEIGTVGLYCVEPESGQRWRLEFDIRSTLETDRTAHLASGEAAGIVGSETIEACQTAIADVFGPAGEQKPSGLIKRLQAAAELPRRQWPPSLLRDLWQAAVDLEEGRRRSPQHEARWLNLVGYALRPGYGVAVDDWRVAQTWRLVHGKLAFPAAASRTESVILWRRIAGGLTKGQQEQLALPLISTLRGKAGKLEAHEATETWRLCASLERLPVALKTELGRIALQRSMQKRQEKLWPALYWAIGRLGSRQPAYGPLNTTVPREEVASWVAQLTSQRGEVGERPLTLVQLARKTGDRFRDLPTEARETALDWLDAAEAPAHYRQLVAEGGRLAGEEEAAVFGEALPLGIRLVR